MKVLAIMRPNEAVDVRAALSEHGRAELHEVWRMYCDGSLLEIYSPGGPGAVLVLETDSVEAAAELLADLPLIASQAMTLELIALRPFTALEMLFK